MELFLTLSIVAVLAGIAAAYGLVLAQQRIWQVYRELDSAWLEVNRQAGIIDQQACTIDRLLLRPRPIAAPDEGTSRSAPSGRSWG